MPFEMQPPVITPADLASEPFKTKEQEIAESYALSLVNNTYWQYELYRTQNHDRRWSNHDSLYFGFIPSKVWDGTNIAKAAFTQQIVFDQVEAAVPAIVNSLFSIAPEWFQVAAEPGTDPADVKQIQDALSYVLEHPRDEFGSNALTDFKLAVKSVLLYGNGGVSIEWDPILARPVVRWVDIRDFYTDPALTTPSIDDGRAVIQRKFLTVQDIMDLRSDKRMSVPPDEVLWHMAKNQQTAPADNTKRIQESLRNIYYSPGQTDYVPLPTDHKIEVLVYYDKHRIIWVLNKEWVMYNSVNPYGFIPFAFAPCYPVIGRFYAQSIGDVQENNQRYTEALLNAHLDELSLLLHPPRVQKRGSLLTPAQQRWRPGAVFGGESKDDVSLLQVSNSTTNVFDDIQYIAQSAERRTGINALGMGSVPQPSNANRTLGGIQAQMGGSSARLSEIVSNIETYLLLPTLYKLYRLIQLHTVPGQAMPALDSNSNDAYYSVDTSIMQRKIKFRIMAASKMVTRDKLMSIVPFYMQLLGQGNFLQSIHQIGKTIDFDVFLDMVQDATGVSHLYKLVRDLTPQEQQQQQKQQQQQQQAQAQQSQAEGQTRKEIMQMKVQGDLQKAQIQKQPDPPKQPDPWQQMIDQQKAQQDMQARAQELYLASQQKQQELGAKRQDHQISLAAKLQQARADVQASNLKSQHARQQSQMDHDMKMQQMMQKLQASQVQAQVQAQNAQINPAGQAPLGGPQERFTQTGQESAENVKRPSRQSEGRHKPKGPGAK